MDFIIEIAAYVCECVTLLLCIHSFLGKKIKLDYKTVLLVVVDVTTLVIVEYFEFSRMWTLINQVFIFGYMRSKFKDNWSQNIIILVLNILVNTALQAIATSPTYIILSKMGYDDSPSAIVFTINIIALIIMICLVRFIKANNLYLKIVKSEKRLIKILYICAIFLLYLIVRYKINYEVELGLYLVSGGLASIVVIVIFYWQRERYENKRKNLELHMHELYVKAFEGMIENIRIRQHNYKNQIAAIYGMHVTSNSFEELVKRQSEYCNYLLKESRYDNVLTMCNDKILAGFLYTKFNEIDKEGIALEFRLSIDEPYYCLPVYRIVEIIGIFLDNAVEYEREYKGDRKIYFEMREGEDKLCILCRNVVDYISFDEVNKFFDKGYSTKGKNRGIGLYNVKNIIEDKGRIIVENREIDNYNWIEFKLELQNK